MPLFERVIDQRLLELSTSVTVSSAWLGLITIYPSALARFPLAFGALVKTWLAVMLARGKRINYRLLQTTARKTSLISGLDWQHCGADRLLARNLAEDKLRDNLSAYQLISWICWQYDTVFFCERPVKRVTNPCKSGDRNTDKDRRWGKCVHKARAKPLEPPIEGVSSLNHWWRSLSIAPDVKPDFRALQWLITPKADCNVLECLISRYPIDNKEWCERPLIPTAVSLKTQIFKLQPTVHAKHRIFRKLLMGYS